MVFLYAQCGPCLAWRQSRTQKKQYKFEKQERAKYTDQPGIIRQPAPREVNPSWEEEILLGPGPVKKGRKRTNTKNSHETSSSGTLAPSEHAGGSLRNLIGDSKKRPMFWNFNRFQRPDEEYTYVDSPEEVVYLPPGLIRKGSSVGVGAWVVDTQQPPSQPKRVYTPTSNMAPVNELHPPVVSSMPAKKEDRAWMTAPPPSSAFMHGKKAATTRSRSGSGNSSLQNQGSDAHLNRYVGQKLMEEKLRSGGQDIVDVEIRPSSRHVSRMPSCDTSVMQRNNSTSPFRLVREKTPTLPMRAREKRPPALRFDSNRSAESKPIDKRVPVDLEASSSSDASHTRQEQADPTYQSIVKPKVNSRAALNSNSISLLVKDGASMLGSTSSSAATSLSPFSTLQQTKDGKLATPATSPQIVDTYIPSPRKRKDTLGADTPIFVKDSSLHILQDVVDPRVLMNSQWVKSPAIEARMPLPAGDSPRKENATPIQRGHLSAKEQLLMDEGVRRWSWTA